MESNNGQAGLEALYNLSEAAVALAQIDAPVWTKLGILMDLENVFDKGRLYAQPLRTEEEEIKFRKIVTHMDTLRGVIRDLLDAQDQTEAREFMKNRGSSAMNQFSLSGV